MQCFFIYAKLSKLIIDCFLKNLLHINLATHRKAGYNRTLQTENKVLTIKILDNHFSLSKVVSHRFNSWSRFVPIVCE